MFITLFSAFRLIFSRQIPDIFIILQIRYRNNDWILINFNIVINCSKPIAQQSV